MSSSSSKKRRSKKERSQSPSKNILKFGDSFKISEKQDQDFENQNKSLEEIIDFGEKKLPKNQSMTILQLDDLMAQQSESPRKMQVDNLDFDNLQE